LLYFAKWFQRKRIFRNRQTRNKNCLWWPCMFMDQNDASYKVSIHLAKQFQRIIFFRNQPTRNKNCLWRPCLLTDRDEMSNLYKGPSIDASYQILVYLVKWFQRRRFICEKLTDNGHQVMAKAHIVFWPVSWKARIQVAEC
jgi:hypothetical protein